MRLLLPIFAVLFAACAPAPAPAPKPPPDPVTEDWYAPVTAQLAAMNREAEGLLRGGKGDRAAAVITKGQALSSRLLAAPRPTLGAMEAAAGSGVGGGGGGAAGGSAGARHWAT